MKQTCDDCLGSGITMFKLWFLKRKVVCFSCGGVGSIEVSDVSPRPDRVQSDHGGGVRQGIDAIPPIAMLSNGTIAGLVAIVNNPSGYTSLGSKGPCNGY
jgi:hypothetical protein